MSRADDIVAGAHEHYDDGVLYDYEYRRRRADVRFYRRLAGEILGGPGEILDLACGTGRVAIPLVRDGHRVVGLDRSNAMLARARARASRIGRAARGRLLLVRADMRNFAFERRFPLAIMVFNCLEHLYSAADITACLRCVHRHLAPGAHFALDVQNPDLKWLSRDPRRRWARTRFRHPTTGEPTQYSTNHVYDPVEQINVIRFYYEARAEPHQEPHLATVRLSQRMFFPAELVDLLRAHGFALVARYGDFEGAPLSGESRSQVLICRPRAD